jgi:hypothetical protein
MKKRGAIDPQSIATSRQYADMDRAERPTEKWADAGGGGGSNTKIVSKQTGGS